MKKIEQLFWYILGGTSLGAVIFAANFAYQNNAKLAVIESKLDTGLAALKECRNIADLNTLEIAVLKEKVRKVGG